MKNSLKHSVLVITYNQEHYIGQCLDSVLNQSVLPYEVIVVDDCSSDGTWEIVKRYTDRYPNIVKPHRNNPNLGVFRNVNKIKELPTGDFVNFVSGDDLLPAGILEAYSRFIEQNQLDCSVPFVVYSDCLLLYPDGTSVRKSNRRVMERYGKNILECVALGCLWGWDTGISAALLRCMRPLRTDMGYQADLLWHLDKAKKAQEHYYLPADGYVYRVSVGVTNATKLTEHLKSKWMVIEEIVKEYETLLTPKAVNYLRFDEAALTYRVEPTWSNYFRMVQLGLRVVPFRYNSPYYHNWRIWVPTGLKNAVKKLLRKQ